MNGPSAERLPAEWEALAAETGQPFSLGGAYASDMFADWRGCVALLHARGATLEGARTLLRSKHMQWCSDGSAESYGHATVADLAAYLDKTEGAREYAQIRGVETTPANDPQALDLDGIETDRAYVARLHGPSVETHSGRIVNVHVPALVARVRHLEKVAAALQEARKAEEAVWLGASGPYDDARMAALRQARRKTHDALRALGVEP